MAIQWIKLPLFNNVKYNYSTVLEGNTYVLNFYYTERTKGWSFSLKDSERNDLVLGQRLTPNTVLFQDYRIPNLSGGFFLTPKSRRDPSLVSGDIRDIADSYDFYYIFNDGE